MSRVIAAKPLTRATVFPPAAPTAPTAPTAERRVSKAASARPTLRVERSLQRQGYRVLAGMDEVGRGALAGPVSVGVVLIDETCRSAPVGVRDSKLLPPSRRATLVAPVRRWALAWAVGHAGPQEIDRIGIMGALRLAGCRALDRLRTGAGVVPDLIILDGNHDWLTDPMKVGLLGQDHGLTGEPGGVTAGGSKQPLVRTLIKADQSCSSVAAASILAKVERDELMIELAVDHPSYRWEVNKGYAAPEHLAALAQHGACVLHRRSWQLPGVATKPEADRAGDRASMGDDEVKAVEVS